MSTSRQPIERAHAEVVFDGDSAAAAVTRLGRVARIATQERINRIDAIHAHTVGAARAVAAVYDVVGECIDEGVRRLERHDTMMERLGEEAVRDHQLGKDNLRRRLQRLGEVAADVLQDTYQRDIEDLLSLPDAVFYRPTPGERLAARWWNDTSIELERRGLPGMTLREQLKEVLVGGVIHDKVTAYDRQQTAERRERLGLIREIDGAHARIAALTRRAAELEALAASAAGGEDGVLAAEDGAADIDVVEALVRQAQQAAGGSPRPALRRRAQGTEVHDDESLG